MRKRLTRRLLILLILVTGLAATASSPSVQKVKAFTPCEDACSAAYSNCLTTASTPASQQRCFDKYSVCMDRCSVE